MTIDTPYALVRRADDAERHALLDVLAAAFLSDSVATSMGDTGMGIV
ncbi:hypothetical protein Aple_053030 [Acrocarpospora pleiomorpha]|uniref:Uncharacterized protein n=1 Tax=Acrocarpospora pleiomorpha TaxID=90975 RepID=A0A5M3XNT5_9ACTN|nr:hypothetical protein [Acrocarpospora pleiomorpha]GES22406.1 hypothetical protein Aple_053030 [Acrocarpospora pleiomorpha]